jgi:hypothetical protein
MVKTMTFARANTFVFGVLALGALEVFQEKTRDVVGVPTAAVPALVLDRGVPATCASEARVSFLGDLNGDGVSEIAVGISHATVTHGERELEDSGAVTVYSGSDGEVLREHLARDIWEELGASVCPLDDIDGDGISDYAIGAAGTMDYSNDAGFVVGSVTVVSGASGDVLYFRAGERARKLGHYVAAIDDLDHDGIADLFSSGRRPTAGGVALSGRGLGFLGVLDADRQYRLADLTGDHRVEVAEVRGRDLRVRSDEEALIDVHLMRSNLFCNEVLVVCESRSGPPIVCIAVPGVSLTSYGGEKWEALAQLKSIGYPFSRSYPMSFSLLYPIGDLDGDAVADLCTYQPRGKVGSIVLLSSRTLAELARFRPPVAGAPGISEVDDLDGNGVSEQLVSTTEKYGHEFSWILFR